MARRCEELASLLLKKGATMSCAESCTGGMIGAAITDASGSSAYFMGSAVTYSNEAKISILGVSETTLMEHGAVSAETAAEMALGASKAFSSDYSVAVTGIAGPGGATDAKPVGLVFISVSDGCRTVTARNLFEGGRAEVRGQTVDAAISLLTDFIKGIL